tara:strand:- start:36633 stop:37808 length:1176 start_codon:yes stop_codon:yes gene_type:complete
MSKLIITDREVGLIKGFFQHTDFNIQQVQSIFSYLERNINTRDIGAIKNSTKVRYAEIDASSESEVKSLLVQYSKVSIQAKKSGFLPKNDEIDMILKAIEIMKSAVLIYNNNNLKTRSENFIVLSVIAWTYVLHTFFRRGGIEPVYTEPDGNVIKINGDHPKLWELTTCIGKPECPLDAGEIRNLKYIIAIRNHVEHRSCEDINEEVQSKLQATALNFVRFVTKHFGDEYNFSEDLAFTIQLTAIQLQSSNALKNVSSVTKAVAAVNKAFEADLSAEDYNDPAYAYRVHVIPNLSNNPNKADQSVTFSPAGSTAEIAIKNVERPKYLATEIIKMMKEKGYKHFNMHYFVQLWKQHDLKNPGKGVAIQLGNSWFWYYDVIDKFVEILPEPTD